MIIPTGLWHRGTSPFTNILATAGRTIVYAVVTLLLGVTSAIAQQQQTTPPPQPEFVKNGQALMREGKMEEALAIYRAEFSNATNAFQAQIAAGIALDLMGRGKEARQHFTKAIETAATPQNKANARRRMAMSYAFENNCKGAARFAQQVFDYQVAEKNFFQQGEIANELARVCLEGGDLDTAQNWYQTGYKVGLQEPDIKPVRIALWNFRWEHAQARLAARRKRKAEAQKHVTAAKALLDASPEMAKDQAIFYPYLTGYVAFYGGDYSTALTELQKANQDDAFIQTLIGRTYEKLGQKDKAMEFYRKAAQVTSHNPNAAYARPFTRKKLGGK